MNPEIQAALERLTKTSIGPFVIRFPDVPLDNELAALIRQGCSEHYCAICTGDNKAYFVGGYSILKDGIKHRQDCALLALCRAIAAPGAKTITSTVVSEGT